MDKKLCKKCGEEKTLEFFTKDKRSKYGFGSICLDCNNLRCKVYRDENEDLVKESHRRYREENPERYKQITNKANKKWREENPEKVREVWGRYREENKEKMKEYRKRYIEENKEKISEREKIYREENKDLIKESHRRYREENKEKLKEYNYNYKKDRLNNDEMFNLTHSIRGIIRKSIKRFGYTKKSRSCEILGCSFEDFKNYIESQFEPWMNWENRGLYNGELNYGWDLDHIIPLASAKTEEEIIRLNHYTNFQPLCSKVNRDIKKDKY